MGNRSLHSLQKRIPAGTCRGFTLIETLVAISVFMLAVIGPLTIIRLALSTAAVSKDQVAAFYLAQDAIEYVVNLRNTNSKNGDPWLSGIDPECIDEECSIDTNEADPTLAIDSDADDCEPLRYDPVSQRYGCDPSWEESPFTRTIRFEEVEPNTEMVLVVTIEWRSGSFNRSLVVPQSMFNIADAIAVAAGGELGGGDGGGGITDPTCSLWPATQSITSGGTAYLSWNTTNTSIVTFSPSLGGASPGTNELNRAVTPSVTTTYQMTANGTGIPATCQAIVTVSGSSGSSLTASPSSVSPGGTVSSNVTNGVTRYTTDWVGLYAISGSSYLSWKYLNNSETAPSSPLSSATVTLTAPTTPGTYELRLFENDGYSLKATSPSFTVASAGDTTAPTTPSGLAASAVSSSQINLSWTTSTDAVGVTGYQVERCQGSGCSNFSQIDIPTTNSYQSTGLSANTTYRYRVRATDAAGNLSSYSSTVQATTPAATPSLIANDYSVVRNTVVTVTAANGPGSPSSNSDWIGMYRVGDSNSAYSAYRRLDGATGGSFTFTMSSTGQYEFRFFQGQTYNVIATTPPVTVCNSGC